MRKLILILSIGLITGASHGKSLFEKQDSTWNLEKCIENTIQPDYV